MTKDGKYLDAIGFGMGEYANNGFIHVGCTIDVAFSLDINEYKGNRNLQLVLKDIKKIKDSDSFIARRKREEEIAENTQLQDSKI